MAERKVRILMGRFGHGYEAALMRLASAFSEAGFEVIYTESEDPEAIVSAAIQESVDHIGITTLPEARLEHFEEMFRLLRREGMEQITVTAGGFLEEDDIPRLKAMGVVEFFPKGTTHKELIQWAKEHIRPIEN
ncbi:MAG: cobalamin-dependent protein [Thermodesulfobacteriota bacterium]|jgi:methylmalonyl-CoA mutase C-terminal domain/subunit|uniref:Methylmalonyl-CoA mutase n=1 Tax=Desulfoglaeba alkanexedens ALDC TaxID=980445 RepID=A0A4P8L4L4_9BACT|nr:cobalamin-dependent protein [Desulfoglaeba alkanexedens]MDY6909654.1 cobalamin-dependent protein [Thermodesulfobacteriota bacterium]QCQ22927.1 methylmalonyl-CoA mutase [Desulfoglaeba alkanexedens ALDC]